MDTILNLIPTVMGLGIIDDNLTGLLTAMEDMSDGLKFPSLVGYAKVIGLGIALGVGANECYQMMLGRRGMDVMKLLHIIIISLCISSSGAIASMARQPAKLLEGIAKTSMESKNQEIAEQEKKVAIAQEKYINKVRDALQQMEEAQKAAHNIDNISLLDIADPSKIKEVLEDGYQYLSNKAKEYALVMETKICEWISLIIRLIGEVILQAILYGLLVAQRIFMHLLEMVAPLMFAISLAPHFKSAWSQWLSKYISLSLWGFVAYCCMYYVFAIISYELDIDAAAYAELAKDIKGDDVQVAAIGMQAVGTTCMYIVGLLVGVKVLSMVPEAASWLIPGGVSSSAGSAAGGTVTAGAMMAKSSVGSVGGTAMGATAAGAAIAGTMAGGSTFVQAVAQNSSLGKAYAEGIKRANPQK